MAKYKQIVIQANTFFVSFIKAKFDYQLTTSIYCYYYYLHKLKYYLKKNIKVLCIKLQKLKNV